MKYRELYESMSNFSDQDFDQDVTLLIDYFDEYYVIDKPLSRLGIDEQGVLDDGHWILVL